MCVKLNDDTLEMSLDFFKAFSIVEIDMSTLLWFSR